MTQSHAILRCARLVLLPLIFLGCGIAHATDMTIKFFERDSLKSIEAAHGTQPYWLVLWDLDCVYCVQSMKNLAAVQKKNPSLHIVTIATDTMDESDAIATRLAEIGLRSQAYAFGNASPEALRFSIDPSWRGENPRAYFYSGTGKRRVVSGVLVEQTILDK